MVYILFVETLSDLLAQHVDVGFIDVSAFVDERYSVVDLDVSQLLALLLPVLIENKQQLLCPSRRENRQQAFSPSLHDLVHVLLELLLPHPPALVHPHPKGTLRNQDIDIGLGNLGLHDIPILLAAIVPSVEHFHPIDFDDEHGCSDDMSSYIGGKFNSFLFCLHSELDWIDPFEAVQNLLGVEERLVLLHLRSISDQVVIDVLCGLGHKYLLLEIGVMREEEGQSTAVVQVRVGDEYQRELFRVDAFEEGQTVLIFLIDHEPAVQHDLFVIDGQDQA